MSTLSLVLFVYAFGAGMMSRHVLRTSDGGRLLVASPPALATGLALVTLWLPVLVAAGGMTVVAHLSRWSR